MVQAARSGWGDEWDQAPVGLSYPAVAAPVQANFGSNINVPGIAQNLGTCPFVVRNALSRMTVWRDDTVKTDATIARHHQLSPGMC